MDFTDKNIDWEKWYRQNKHMIPAEYRADFENNLGMLQFLFSVYFKVMHDLTPLLKTLMFRQYPVLKTEKRPRVVEYIDKFINSVGTKMLFKLNGLIQGQNEGVKVREKYPEFDRWVEFYGRPQSPKVIKDSDRNKPWRKKWTDSQWEEYKKTQNEQLLIFFNWNERRKSEFIDILQPILFENYRELEELNADELIIYAVIIYDEYDYYLSLCEHIELFIDSGFPEEEIALSDKEFMENYLKLDPEIRQKNIELRSRRIAGERI